MAVPSAEQYQSMIDALTDGALVPFLGAGANLCDRPEKTSWQQGQYLPNGSELAQYLADEFHYPDKEKEDLIRVSEYATLMRGSGSLYMKLHHVFDASYPLTSLHTFLAHLPSVLRARAYVPYQLLVTTNYDDLLEQAFIQAQELFDLVTYEAEGPYAGKFWHHPPEGEPRIIEKPNEYKELSLQKRSVILKIHGAVDRANNGKEDSFVITEDHYIDYLTRTNVSALIPVTLLEKLRNSNLLFLGYSLKDWNLRAILHNLWGEQKFKWTCWAIHKDPSELDVRLWKKRDVEIYDMALRDFVLEMDARAKVLPPAGG